MWEGKGYGAGDNSAPVTITVLGVAILSINCSAAPTLLRLQLRLARGCVEVPLGTWGIGWARVGRARPCAWADELGSCRANLPS